MKAECLDIFDLDSFHSGETMTNKPYVKLLPIDHRRAGYMVEVYNGHDHVFFSANTEFLTLLYFTIEKKIVSSDTEEKAIARPNALKVK